MKHLGLALLAAGVALAAATGARLAPGVSQGLADAGAARFRQEAAREAFDAWCAARQEAALPLADGCPPPDGAAPAEAPGDAAPAAAEPPPTYEARVAAARARLAALRDGAGPLPPELQLLRDAWLAAEDAAVEPVARAAEERPVPPEERLRAWAGQSGLPFLLGLALVVAGAVLGRRAVHAEATREAPARAGDDGPRDFGELLRLLRDEVRAVATDMAALAAPHAGDVEHLKDRLETLQLERFERLVAARGRVQARYGMAGFAEIFGPLSSAERRVNRTWSALVDHHWPEALDSVTRAAADLDAAMEVLERQAARAA